TARRSRLSAADCRGLQFFGAMALRRPRARPRLRPEIDATAGARRGDAAARPVGAAQHRALLQKPAQRATRAAGSSAALPSSRRRALRGPAGADPESDPRSRVAPDYA